MELMVAMAITTIIVTVLVSITSIALDTWNRSRSELRASRQAKALIDIMARDFESLVVRKGNTSEWLAAVVDPDLSDIGDKMKSTNAARLVFFSAATDRYDGDIGNTTKDKGGDVSCIAYQLQYVDPVDPTSTGNTETFVLNRLLVNPDKTFTDLLGKTDSKVPAKTLDAVFSNSTYDTSLRDPNNFICENVYQFSITFHVQATTVPATATTPATIVNVPITIGRDSDTFGIGGSENRNDYSGTVATKEQISAGRVVAVGISATVVSDYGMGRMATGTFSTAAEKAKFFAQNSYQYSKTVQIPSM